MKIYIRPFNSVIAHLILFYLVFSPFLSTFLCCLLPPPPTLSSVPVLLSGRVFNAKRQIRVYNLGESLEKSKKNV